MCGKKFELKIDDVRFVGHPTLLQHPPIIQVGQQFASSALGWPFVSTSMTFFFLRTILAVLITVVERDMFFFSLPILVVSQGGRKPIFKGKILVSQSLKKNTQTLNLVEMSFSKWL